MEAKATALQVNKLTQSNRAKLTRSLAPLGENRIAVVVLPVCNLWTGYVTALLYDGKSLVQVFFYLMAG
jgi:hypothetical protein